VRSAFAFLSVFGRASTPTSTTFAWFPVVGTVIGLLVGTVWWASDRLWPPLVAAVIVVIADLALTGMLHFDGLADSGDGLLAPMTRERRLQAMSDPAIGAFGLLSVVAILILRVSALGAMRPSILAIAGLWCASRTAMVAISLLLPYAKDEGIVRAFLGATSRARAQRNVLIVALVSGIALATTALAVARSWRGMGALVIELVAMALVAVLSWRRLGGYTGDVLGAAGVVGETVGLLVLALR
jgi:adenosylcobinamide-GDP ribazoletransferase